jgi:hypothetical protein
VEGTAPAPNPVEAGTSNADPVHGAAREDTVPPRAEDALDLRTGDAYDLPGRARSHSGGDDQMQWNEIRARFPSQWLLIEAVAAHSEGEKRILDDLAVLGSYSDVRDAMASYKERHGQSPMREFYVLHTDRQELDITNLHWRRFPLAS